MKAIEDDDGTLYLCLFATDNVPTGHELRYNYDDECDNMWWREEVYLINILLHRT